MALQVKLLNRLLDVLGHQFKFGDVASHFRALDAQVRQAFRQWLRVQGYGFTNNAAMDQLGLRSLQALLAQHRSQVARSRSGVVALGSGFSGSGAEGAASPVLAPAGSAPRRSKRGPAVLLASQVLASTPRANITVNTVELEVLLRKQLAQQKEMISLLQKILRAQS